MRFRTAALVLVLLVASVPIAVAQAIADKRASDHARGLVYRGMEPAQTDGPCRTGWELQLPRGKPRFVAICGLRMKWQWK